MWGMRTGNFSIHIGIHIDVRFHNTLLIVCIIKIPSKYLLVKFYVIIYLLYALFKILMISLLVLVRYRNSGIFSVGANFSVSEFLLAFPDYGAGKNSCEEIVAPDVGRTKVYTQSTDYTAQSMTLSFALDHGVGVGPFCKLQNIV